MTPHTTSTSTLEGIPSNPPSNSSSMSVNLASTIHSNNSFFSPHFHSSWCINDSRAARTMSNDKYLFRNLGKPIKKSFVTLVNESKSHIVGKGRVSLNPNCTVSPTFYIPEFPMNLLSVSQVIKQFNCKVTFFPSYCLL